LAEEEGDGLVVGEEEALDTADAAMITPPCKIVGLATVLTFTALAAVLNSSIVCDPLVGPLITPTIPDSQCKGKPQ